MTVWCRPELVDQCRGFLEDDFFKAFVDESRLKIFLVLMEKGEMTVNDVSRDMEINQSNVSRHLAYLKRAGVAISKRNGRETSYRIDYENVAERLQSILTIVRECCSPVKGEG